VIERPRGDDGHGPVVRKEEPLASAVGGPPSRKAREGGHPHFLLCEHLENRRYTYSGDRGHPPVAKWYQWDSIDGSSKGLFTELSGGEGVTGGVGAQATPGQNTEYYAFVGPGVKNAGPFSGNVSGFVSTDFSSYGSQGFAAEGAFGRATGGVGVYMNFMSLTACMDKAH